MSRAWGTVAVPRAELDVLRARVAELDRALRNHTTQLDVELRRAAGLVRISASELASIAEESTAAPLRPPNS